MITAIIQARMGSARLPGKIMEEIEGEPMLWRVVERVRRSKKIGEIIIATTLNEQDEKVREFSRGKGIKVFSGSENDVLDRYYQSALFFGKPETIVRITSDCPLIDPEIIDKTIEFFLGGDLDYASTGRIQSTFPDGLDTEVFKFSVLERAWKEAKLASEREHVTTYIWKNPEIFRVGELKNDKDLSSLRWTVDEERDLNFIRKVYGGLYNKGEIFYMKDVIALIEDRPELLKENKGIVRDEGYFKSLKEDREKR